MKYTVGCCFCLVFLFAFPIGAKNATGVYYLKQNLSSLFPAYVYDLRNYFHQVNDANLVVKDSSGNNMEVQYLRLDNVTRNLRSFYTKAYLGLSGEPVPQYWLHFEASVPPLGWNTYFVSKAAVRGGMSAYSSFGSFISCMLFILVMMICHLGLDDTNIDIRFLWRLPLMFIS